MRDNFSQQIAIDVSSGFIADMLTSRLSDSIRLVDADLSKLHASDNNSKPPLYVPDNFGGNHSDIVDGNIKAQNFGNIMTDFFNKIKTTSAAVVATHIVFSAL